MRTLDIVAVGLAAAGLAAAAIGCSDDGTGGLHDIAGDVTSDASDTRDSSATSDTRDGTTTTTTTTSPTDATTTDAPDVGPPTIGWVILQYPPDHRGAPGSTLSVYGRVYVAGVTDAAGQGAGVEAEAGIGTGAVEGSGWAWTAASFNVDADNNDEYVAALTLPASDGTYAFAFRFRLTGGDWVYADRDSSDDGFDLADAGALEVVTPSPAAIDWCRLQYPEAVTVAPEAPVGIIYGRVYEAGVTETVSGEDDAYPIVGELGFGAGDAAVADWTWVPATWARDSGNDDEFEATFAAPDAPGTWRYGYRFRLDADGAADWLYCDLDGTDDGFDVADAGTLTVAEPPPDVVDFATLRPALLTWAAGEAPPSFEVVVYEPDVTPGEGQGAGIVVRVGYGAADAALETFTWVDATYLGDEDGLATDDNDVYAAALPDDLAAASYAVVATVAVGDGEPLSVDASGTPDGFDLEDAAVAEVTPPTPPLPAWCELLAAEQITVAPGASAGPIDVQIYQPELTPGAGAALHAEIGVGPAGTTPDAAWTWVAATFARSTGNDDVWSATLTAPAVEGQVSVAARAGLDDSEGWRLCDRDGSDNGFAPDQTTRLVTLAPRVDYCRIQWPVDPVTMSVGATSTDLFGAFYEPGVTGETGSHAPELKTQVGFGATGSTPGDAWTWSDGSFNGFLDNGFGQKNNDEHRGSLAPAAAGSFDWAWRASLDGGATWVYCDQAGTQPYDPAKAGKLVVSE